MPTLAEDLLLLLLEPTTGRPVKDATHVDYALGGAALVELALLERVTVEPARFGGQDVVVVDASPTGSAVLDEALRRTGERRRKAKALVPKISKDLRHQVTTELQRREILRVEPRSGLFTRERLVVTDAGYVEALRERLRASLLGGDQPDQRTAGLVAMLSAADAVPDALRVALDRRQRRAVKDRAAAIAAGSWAAVAVRKAVEAVQAGVTAGMVAVMASTTASS